MSIGKNIAVYRKNKGLTQGELGELLGVTNQAVSKWESEVSMPDVMLLPEIAKALGVTVEDLYALRENRPAVNADDRIIIVNVDSQGTKIKCAFPLEAMKNIFTMDDEDSEAAKIFSGFDGDFTGTVVDVEDESAKVLISVEHYENKNL